jgi:hypothetical protein
MLNVSASASSSRDRNFFPDLCFGFDAWLLRAVAVPAGPDRRADESLEKNCWVWERAGLTWFEVVICEDLFDALSLLVSAGGG